MGCLEAVFEDISCACGRTVLQPPQPCGTKPPECRFECTRQRTCGHPQVKHQCHEDSEECPKCPFLVEKPCICGKKTLKNQPCWFTEVRCGLPCNKKLRCGNHFCQKMCHRAGQCEDATSPCTQACGRQKTVCEHTCLDPCHAPYPCKEVTPCQAKTFVTCECQNQKQAIKCLASKSSPGNSKKTLDCNEECLRLQRNAKLAAALNIDPATHTDDHIPYSTTTLSFFADHQKFGQQYEREFRVFAADDTEKRLRFKPMQPHQRAFIHALAEDFGLDSESQDPEPHRHVCIFKTPRFVSSPMKTLSQCVKIRAAPVAEASVSKPLVKIDKELAAIKALVSKKVSTLGLASLTTLCAVDSSLNVVRREDENKASGGWSQVARGGAAARSVPQPTVGAKSSYTVLGTKRMKENEKKKALEEAADDWELEADADAE